MTKDDSLFDIKNVIFDADEAQSLIGKDVFVSDSLINMRDAVNEMRTDSPYYYGKLLSVKDYGTCAAFNIDSDERIFRYVYYDQYYKLKCALKRGETIEHRLSSDYWCIITCPSFDDKPEYYRIKQEKPALKWQDLKIGDILRGPLYDIADDIYGIVNMIDVNSTTDKHIHFGDSWITDEEICKFRRVDIRGVSVK